MNKKISNLNFNDKLQINYPFGNLRFTKIKLNSINKTLLIPEFFSKSSLSTSHRTNSSLGRIISKDKKTKINEFNKRTFILKLTNNKSNDIINNNKIKFVFSPLMRRNKSISSNYISFSGQNSFSKSSSKLKENSSSFIKPFKIDELTFLSKKENNPINKNNEEFSIRIEKRKMKNNELKSIFQINNNINSKKYNIANKIKPKNKNILKSNFSRKKILLNNKKVNIEQKNKDFLNFLINNNNNKDKIEKIETLKKNEIKNNIIKAKNINDERKKNYEIQNNKETKLELFNYKKIFFIEINFPTEMNLNNIIFDLMEIKAESHLYESNIQYILLKYNFQNIFLSYIGFSKPKKNKFIPSINNETIEKQKLFKINLEKEICSQKIIYKENENKNIKKLSVIEQKEPKRNTQLKSNKFWPRFSLLNNIEFFSNKKPKNKSVTINNENRRNSYFIRSMYTNINRRKSLPKKLILKKEDFQLLKLLIQNRKENKFLFEFHKLINIYDINSSDNHGNTLLTYACINGEFQIVKYLLKNGANPNCINKYKNTPLHYALSNKYYEIADLLIQNKAKDNIENIYGLTPW